MMDIEKETEKILNTKIRMSFTVNELCVILGAVGAGINEVLRFSADADTDEKKELAKKMEEDVDTMKEISNNILKKLKEGAVKYGIDG